MSETDVNITGTQTVTVSYNGLEATFEVTVYESHMDGETIMLNEPSCTVTGNAEVHCRLCGEIIRNADIEPLGHEFSEDFTLDEEPTYTEKGQMSRHCIRCQEITDITEIERLISVLLGDASGDNDVTMADVLIIRKHIAGISDIEEAYLANADTDENDDITMSDVLTVRKIVAGII